MKVFYLDYTPVSLEGLKEGIDYVLLTKNVGILEGKDDPESKDYISFLVDKAYNNYRLAYDKQHKLWAIYDLKEKRMCSKSYRKKEDAIDKANELVDNYLEATNLEDIDYQFIRLKDGYYLGKVNLLNAYRCKLVGIKILKGKLKGAEILCIGLGLDEEAQLIAYQALTFQALNKKYVSRLLDHSYREFFCSVVGEEVYLDVASTLGI